MKTAGIRRHNVRAEKDFGPLYVVTRPRCWPYNLIYQNLSPQSLIEHVVSLQEMKLFRKY